MYNFRLRLYYFVRYQWSIQLCLVHFIRRQFFRTDLVMFSFEFLCLQASRHHFLSCVSCFISSHFIILFSTTFLTSPAQILLGLSLHSFLIVLLSTVSLLLYFYSYDICSQIISPVLFLQFLLPTLPLNQFVHFIYNFPY